jgi:exodeoxyribonuclease VII large subunit
LLRQLGVSSRRLRQAQLRTLERTMQRVDGLSRRLVHPAARLERQSRDVGAAAGRLARALSLRLAAADARLGGLAQRVAWRLAHPLPQAARLPPVALSLVRATRRLEDGAETRVAVLARSLAHLNPQAVLDRGYAIVTAQDGAIVEDAAGLRLGDEVEIALARGTAGATIKRL